MAKINSRDKGKRGELEAAHFLTDAGYPASRGRQYSGRDDAPDIVCNSLPGIHWEIKRVEQLNIESALKQAEHDAGNKLPIVMHRRNGNEWKLTLRASTFAPLLGMLQGLLAQIILVESDDGKEKRLPKI